MKTFYLGITCIALGLCNCGNQKTSTSIQERHNNEICLTTKNFNLVKNFISENGIQIKLFKIGLIADTTTMSKQLFINGKRIAITEYQNHHKIIVNNIFYNDTVVESENNLCPYFVSDKDSLILSSYYNHIDTDKSLKLKSEDWCRIVDMIKNEKHPFPTVNQKIAMKIAQMDAKLSYRDLSVYNVEARYKEGNWYVDYDLNNPQMNGGGPHYIICGKTGIILMRRYDQ